MNIEKRWDRSARSTGNQYPTSLIVLEILVRTNSPSNLKRFMVGKQMAAGRCDAETCAQLRMVSRFTVYPRFWWMVRWEDDVGRLVHWEWRTKSQLPGCSTTFWRKRAEGTGWPLRFPPSLLASPFPTNRSCPNRRAEDSGEANITIALHPMLHRKRWHLKIHW